MADPCTCHNIRELRNTHRTYYTTYTHIYVYSCSHLMEADTCSSTFLSVGAEFSSITFTAKYANLLLGNLSCTNPNKELLRKSRWNCCDGVLYKYPEKRGIRQEEGGGGIRKRQQGRGSGSLSDGALTSPFFCGERRLRLQRTIKQRMS